MVLVFEPVQDQHILMASLVSLVQPIAKLVTLLQHVKDVLEILFYIMDFVLLVAQTEQSQQQPIHLNVFHAIQTVKNVQDHLILVQVAQLDNI
jgi:hypothetical protein